MLRQALSASSAAATMVISAELAAKAPRGLEASEALGALEGWVQEELACASALQELPLSRLSLSFDGAGAGCSYGGAELSGALKLEVPSDEGATWLARVSHIGFRAGAGTVTGDAVLEEGGALGAQLELESIWWGTEELELTGGLLELDTAGTPQEPQARAVALSLAWYDEQGRWELLADDLSLRPGASMPDAGSIGMSDPLGRVATIHFEQAPSGASLARFSGIREEWVFELDSQP